MTSGWPANFNSQSGIAVTRQVIVAQTVGGNSTVNVEPLGSDAARCADGHGPPRVQDRSTSATRAASKRSVDFNNLFNVNTAWDVRTLSGTINLRQNGDPTGAINTVPQFLSPAQVYGPRNIRFNVAFRF